MNKTKSQLRCEVLLYVPRCPGRGRGECGRGSVGDVVVRIRLFLLLVRQLLRKREIHASTREDIAIAVLPQQSRVCALCLCACCYARMCAYCSCMHRCRRSRRTAHCRSTTAIKRIQFPQSSIPVCLLSAEIRNEGREWQR